MSGPDNEITEMVLDAEPPAIPGFAGMAAADGSTTVCSEGSVGVPGSKAIFGSNILEIIGESESADSSDNAQGSFKIAERK